LLGFGRELRDVRIRHLGLARVGNYRVVLIVNPLHDWQFSRHTHYNVCSLISFGGAQGWKEGVMDSAPRASATESDGNGRRGLIDLARVAVEDTVRLVQQEIQLAKIELKEMLASNLKAAVFLGIAAFCGLLFFIMLLVTIALVIPAHALVAGIETVLFLILAAVLGLIGKGMLKVGAPPKTMTTLKEDAEWAKQVLKRNGK
jgi:uncharacterized membrane protein YqjE